MQVNEENWGKKKIEGILAHKEKHSMFSVMRGLVPNLLLCVFSWEYTWKPGNWKQATGENVFREGRQQNVDEMKVEGRDGESGSRKAPAGNGMMGLGMRMGEGLNRMKRTLRSCVAAYNLSLRYNKMRQQNTRDID